MAERLTVGSDLTGPRPLPAQQWTRRPGGLGANTGFPPLLLPTARACVSNRLLASGLEGSASLK